MNKGRELLAFRVFRAITECSVEDEECLAGLLRKLLEEYRQE